MCWGGGRRERVRCVLGRREERESEVCAGEDGGERCVLRRRERESEVCAAEERERE